jgi:hypothetical protein
LNSSTSPNKLSSRAKRRTFFMSATKRNRKSLPPGYRFSSGHGFSRARRAQSGAASAAEGIFEVGPSQSANFNAIKKMKEALSSPAKQGTCFLLSTKRNEESLLPFRVASPNCFVHSAHAKLNLEGQGFSPALKMPFVSFPLARPYRASLRTVQAPTFERASITTSCGRCNFARSASSPR